MESRSTSLIARKRKQPPSSSTATPLISSFNRSKSRRSDIAFTSPADDEDSSRHTVNLICSRRIFSPDPWDSKDKLGNSIPDSSREPHQIVQEKQNESTCLLNQGSSGFNYNALNCSSGMLNPVDDGGNVQTTPPEAVVGSVGAAANASQVADRTTLVEPAAKYKQGRLNPQFRGRLVKSPVSFSYRRLLPYLMDIAKEDDSGDTTTNACKKKQNTQGGFIPIQKVPEDVICCNRDNPTGKEAAAIVGRVNGSLSPSNKPSRNLSPSTVINCNCGSESKRRDSKDGEDDGKIDHSSGHGKAPAENKPVEEDISKPCRKKVTQGTKEVLVMSQIDDVSVGVSRAQASNRLLQSSILHNSSADFVTSTGSMKSNNKYPPKNKKLLLNPCSRLKISKGTNNSFSYKRLLPYLMEIAMENSGAANESTSPTEEVKNTQLQQQQQHSPPHQFEDKQAAPRMPPPSTDPTYDSSKEAATIIGHVNDSSPPSRDLSSPLVINFNCCSESKWQDLKDGEDDGKIYHSSGHENAPAENKPVEGDTLVLLHPLNNNVEVISKTCRKGEETHGTKEVVLLRQIDISDVSRVSNEEGNSRLMQSSILHNNNADFVTSTSIMKSNDKSPSQNKKLLLNPCSRLNLSESTNNSSSYKRLLRYPMEIAMDYSGAACDSPSPTEEGKKKQQDAPPHLFVEEQVALTMPPPSTIIVSSSDSILLKDDNDASTTSSSTPVEETPQGLVLEAVVSTTTARSRDDKLEPANENHKKVDLISPLVEQPLIGGSPDTIKEVDRLILVQEEEEESPPKIERESIRIGQVGSTTPAGLFVKLCQMIRWKRHV